MNKHGSGPNGHSPNTMMLCGIYNLSNVVRIVYTIKKEIEIGE
jgi:hypothetical protein